MTTALDAVLATLDFARARNHQHGVADIALRTKLARGEVEAALRALLAGGRVARALFHDGDHLRAVWTLKSTRGL